MFWPRFSVSKVMGLSFHFFNMSAKRRKNSWSLHLASSSCLLCSASSLTSRSSVRACALSSAFIWTDCIARIFSVRSLRAYSTVEFLGLVVLTRFFTGVCVAHLRLFSLVPCDESSTSDSPSLSEFVASSCDVVDPADDLALVLTPA